MPKYDWKKVQEYMDMGHTYRETQDKFGMSSAAIAGARKRGDLQTLNRSEAQNLSHKRGKASNKHTEQTKQKISESRRKYLLENPDKVPYLLNHSSKQSYPEKLFQKALEQSGINGWKYNLQVGLYQYDFAFTDQKIDVEIDGSTHNLPKVKKIDRRRDEFSTSNGWMVIRFTAKQVKEDLIGCINLLKLYL